MTDTAVSTEGTFRILIADDDGVYGRHLIDFFKERGFSAELAVDGKAARKLIIEWMPHFIIADLTLIEGNAFELLAFINGTPKLKAFDIKFFVTSVHNSIENVKRLIREGACDYLIRPFKPEDLLTRIVFHIQNKREIVEPSQAKLEGSDIYLQLLDIVLKEAIGAASLSETLYKFTKMVAITLKAVRCSVIEVSEDRFTGRVMASSDDKNARGIRLDLNKYPEVIHVINTEKPVVIEDLEYNKQMAAIKKMFKNIHFNSLLVCPLFQRGRIYGVLSARMDKNFSKFNERDLRFSQLVAMIASLVLCSDLALPHEFQVQGSGDPNKKVS